MFSQIKPGCYISSMDSPQVQPLKSDTDGQVIFLLTLGALMSKPVYEDIDSLPDQIRQPVETALANGMEARLSDEQGT